MKVVAFSIRSIEKECLAIANQKKHDITLISNTLSIETLNYAEGKNAVLVFINDDLSTPIISKLAEMGIKFIVSRSVSTQNINLKAATEFGIQIANAISEKPQQIAEYCIAKLDAWQQQSCLGKACACSKTCPNHTPKAGK